MQLALLPRGLQLKLQLPKGARENRVPNDTAENVKTCFLHITQGMVTVNPIASNVAIMHQARLY